MQFDHPSSKFGTGGYNPVGGASRSVPGARTSDRQPESSWAHKQCAQQLSMYGCHGMDLAAFKFWVCSTAREKMGGNAEKELGKKKKVLGPTLYG